MIAGSRSLGGLALAVAVAFHAMLAWALMADTEVEVESSAGAQEARIGTSFADMAAGTLQATETQAVAEPTEMETPDAVQPETVTPVQPEAIEPVKAEPVQADSPEVTETPRAVPELAADAVPTVSAPTPETVAEPTPPTEQAEPVASETAQDVITAQDQQAVSRSLRPMQRSEAFEKKNQQVARTAAPKPEVKNTPQPKKQPRGNAKQDSTAGATTGNARAKATTSGAARGDAAASGNAAASNYPGRVMQRLSRVPRPRAGARGTVVVAFRVSGGGGLAGVSVARSSGSGALDRAAVNMIRSAAPFPAPPPGARRSFSISIEGR